MRLSPPRVPSERPLQLRIVHHPQLKGFIDPAMIEGRNLVISALDELGERFSAGLPVDCSARMWDLRSLFSNRQNNAQIYRTICCVVSPITREPYPVTRDGRYFVVKGQLWRCPHPNLDEDRKMANNSSYAQWFTSLKCWLSRSLCGA